MTNEYNELLLKQASFEEETLKELGLVPIGLAMMNNDTRYIEGVKPQWFGDPYVQQMYNEVRNFSSPYDYFMAHGTEPMFKQAITLAAGNTASIKGILDAIRKHYVEAQQMKLIASIFSARDDQEKLIAVNTLRGLLGNDDAEEQVVDLSNPTEDFHFMLELNGVGFLAKKTITAIKAKAKSGKSHLCAIFMAALTGSHDVLGIRQKDGPKKVLYIDTEQEMPSTEYLVRHVHRLNGWDTNRNHANLTVVNVRRIRSDQRLSKIEKHLLNGGYDTLVIDGIKDLMVNINDPEQSTKVMDEILRLIDIYNVSLVTVIHENKGESTEMRGHIGTELLNKAYEVLEVVKDKDNGLFKVECTDRRGPDLDTWAFGFNERNELERKDVPAAPVKLSQADRAANVRRDTLDKCFSYYGDSSLEYAQLYTEFQKHTVGSDSKDAFNRFIRTCIKNEELSKDEQTGRYYVPKEQPYINNALLQSVGPAPF